MHKVKKNKTYKVFYLVEAENEREAKDKFIDTEREKINDSVLVEEASDIYNI